MKYMFYIVVVFVFLLQLSYSKLFGTKEEKFVELKYARICKENNDNIQKINLIYKKYNRTHIGIYMNLTVPEVIDEKYELEFEIRLWGDGGWKKNFVHMRRKDPCRTLYLLLGPTWAAMVEAGHAEQGCPVKAGFYYLDNVYFDLSKCQLILQPGRFFVFTRVLKGPIVQSCVEIEVEIKSV